MMRPWKRLPGWVYTTTAYRDRNVEETKLDGKGSFVGGKLGREDSDKLLERFLRRSSIMSLPVQVDG
jgi:hypothetical protein